MKNLLFFSLLFIVTYVHAQSPQSFKYQAVLRDNNGLPLIEKNITIKISILQGSLTGLTAYSEVHQAKTSPVGVVNLEIGKGSQNIGNFTTISWGTNTHFVKIEIDPLGEATSSRLVLRNYYLCLMPCMPKNRVMKSGERLILIFHT